MPPPPVAMTASKLKIQALQEQLKQKDRAIHALEAEKHSLLAVAAEKAKLKELAKMNSGWRKHNANPYTAWSYRSKGITGDMEGNTRIEKVIFVTEYKFAMERVKKFHAEAELAEARIQVARMEQRRAYCKTQELIKVAEELEVKVEKQIRTKIAKSSLGDDRDMTTTDENSRDSDGDVDMGELTTAAAPENDRFLLKSPKRERSVSVEGILPTRLRLRQPKRRKLEESTVPVEAVLATRLRLSQPKADQCEEYSHRARSGRVHKASAKATE